jgi:cytochrome c-type biogenesis protein CcmH/NrfF
MSSKTRLRLIGFLLWMTPIVAVSIGFNALLDCYVSESYRAAVSEAMEG